MHKINRVTVNQIKIVEKRTDGGTNASSKRPALVLYKQRRDGTHRGSTTSLAESIFSGILALHNVKGRCVLVPKVPNHSFTIPSRTTSTGSSVAVPGGRGFIPSRHSPLVRLEEKCELSFNMNYLWKQIMTRNKKEKCHMPFYSNKNSRYFQTDFGWKTVSKPNTTEMVDQDETEDENFVETLCLNH